VIRRQCSFAKCDAPARSARRWRRTLIPLSSASRVPRQFHCHRNTPLHPCGVPHAPLGPILARCSRPASLPPPTFLDVGAIGSDILRILCWSSSCGTARVCVSHDARTHAPFYVLQPLLRSPPRDPPPCALKCRLRSTRREPLRRLSLTGLTR